VVLVYHLEFPIVSSVLPQQLQAALAVAFGFCRE
jgi:phytoene/squalene synthetase